MKYLVIIVAIATVALSLPHRKLNLPDPSISSQDGIQTVTDNQLNETLNNDAYLSSRSLFGSPVNQRDDLFPDYDDEEEEINNDMVEENKQQQTTEPAAAAPTLDVTDEELFRALGEENSSIQSTTTAQPLPSKQKDLVSDTDIFPSHDPISKDAGIDVYNDLTDDKLFQMLGGGDSATKSNTPLPALDLTEEEIFKQIGEENSSIKSTTTAQPLPSKQKDLVSDTGIFPSHDPISKDAGIDVYNDLTDDKLFQMLGGGDSATKSNTPLPALDLTEEEIFKRLGEEISSIKSTTTVQPLNLTSDTYIFKSQEPISNDAEIDGFNDLTDEELLKMLGRGDSATKPTTSAQPIPETRLVLPTDTSSVLNNINIINTDEDLLKVLAERNDAVKPSFQDIGDNIFIDDDYFDDFHDDREINIDTSTSTSTTPATITEFQTHHSETGSTEYPPEDITESYDYSTEEDTTSTVIIIPNRYNEQSSSCNYQPSDQPIQVQRRGKRVSEIQCEYNMWQYKYYILEAERKTNECLKVMNNTTAIIGGKKAEDGEFPHMGAVGWRKLEGGYTFMCGSSLISTNFAITAAHCHAIPEFLRSEKQLAKTFPEIVRFGTVKIQDFKDKYSLNDEQIDIIIKLPKYKSNFKYNDVALIKFTRDVPIKSYIRPACLWNGFLNGHSEGNVTGWGKTSKSTHSNHLLYATLDFINQSTCKTLLEDYTNKAFRGLMEHQMCAGKLSGSSDTCQGDSGGPIQIQQAMPSSIDEAGTIHHVVGITSFGIGCARKNIPGVYVNVSDPNILCWIEKTVWPDEPNPFCPDKMFEGYNPLKLT